MSNDGASPNDEGGSSLQRLDELPLANSFVIPHSVIRSKFEIRNTFRGEGAFTLIELLVVMAIIIILSGLILSTASYAQKKGLRARAETEIAGIAAALESYKADNGMYPRGPVASTTIGSTTIPANVTDALNSRTSGDPTSTTDPSYSEASLYLYTQLSGDSTGNRQPTGKTYFSFKANMLTPGDQTQTVQSIRDPFGNSYGYSTAYQQWVDAGSSGTQTGYNPTFDLWTTSGLTTNPPSATDQDQWIKNW